MGVSIPPKSIFANPLSLPLAQKLEENCRTATRSNRCPVPSPMVESTQPRDGEGPLDGGGGPDPHELCQRIRRIDMESDSIVFAR